MPRLVRALVHVTQVGRDEIDIVCDVTIVIVSPQRRQETNIQQRRAVKYSIERLKIERIGLN